MRVVDRKAFLKLPPGTAYQKGKPWAWEGLQFKTDDQYENDWRYLDVDDIEAFDSGEMFDRLEEMKTIGASYPIGKSSTRDGCFDDADIFLVYEPADLMHLSGMIEKAIVVATLPSGKSVPEAA